LAPAWQAGGVEGYLGGKILRKLEVRSREEEVRSREEEVRSEE
jgi:hypothetical protein